MRRAHGGERNMLSKALFAILISQLVACGWLFGEDSDKSGDTDSVPTNVISGELKSSLSTSVTFEDSYGSSSSCYSDKAGDTYVETEHFLIFGQTGVTDSTKQFVGQAAEKALVQVTEKLGYTVDEFLSYKSKHTPGTYGYIYGLWSRNDDHNPEFTAFEMLEPFIQGFREMGDADKDIAMYQYWINLDFEEQNAALLRAAPNGIDHIKLYDERISYCITTSGYAGTAYEYTMLVLDPSIAIGTTTQGLKEYQYLINHEFTHIVMNIVTRERRSESPRWVTEGIPEYVSGHSPASSAKSFDVNVVRDIIGRSDGSLSQYPAYHFAIKYLVDDLGNGQESIGQLLLNIRNDELRNGGEGRDIQRDPETRVKYKFLRAFEQTFTDLSGNPISYTDYIDIYENLLK